MDNVSTKRLTATGLEGLALPAYIQSRQGVLQFVNTTFAGMFGRSPEHLTGLAWNDLLTLESAQQAMAEDERVLRGELLQSEVRVRQGEFAQQIVLLITKTLAYTPDWGEAIVGIGQDVTAWRRAGTTQRSDREQTEALAHLSHELRTPLNAIAALSDFLLDTQLKVDQRELVKLIQSSAESSVALLTDILDRSRAGPGRLSAKPLEFSIRECLDGVLKPFTVKAAAQHLEFSVTVGPEIPAVLFGDPMRLRQVLQNLVTNALKFTAQGSVSVHARVSARAECSITLEFQVKDTGVGIPKDKHALIFEPFVQADPAGSPRGAIGLGLSISSRILAMLDGKIWVESVPGAGSTFYFTLPFGIPKAAGGQQREPLSILLVEDDAVTQNAMQRLMEREGHRVDAATSGESALALWRSRDYDVVLMDLQGPRLNGCDASREIRRQEAGTSKHIPIIAISGDANESTVQDCLDSGMDEFLMKPVQTERLLDTMERLRQTRAAAGGGAPPLDRESALSMAGHDAKLLRELAHLFLLEFPGLLAALRGAVADRDPKRIEMAAHSLKGSVANFGARPAAELAMQLEWKARNGEVEGIDRDLAALEVVLDPVVRELQLMAG